MPAYQGICSIGKLRDSCSRQLLANSLSQRPDLPSHSLWESPGPRLIRLDKESTAEPRCSFLAQPRTFVEALFGWFRSR